jgi:hypothetical protein
MLPLEKCVVCGDLYESRRLGSMYCRAACKHKAMRRRQDAVNTRNSQAADLLRRQTRAVTDGADPAVLASIIREAEALFAGSV